MLSNSDTNWLDEHTERGTSPRPSTYIIYITTPRITTINEQLTRRAFFVSRKHWQEEIKICQPAIYFSKSVIRMKLYHHQRQIHRNRFKHINSFGAPIILILRSNLPTYSKQKNDLILFHHIKHHDAIKWGAAIVQGLPAAYYEKLIFFLLPTKKNSPMMQMMASPDSICPVSSMISPKKFSSVAMMLQQQKEKFSYIFRQSDYTLSKYTIGTWSKKVKRNKVIKNGTALDICRLPAATKFNKSKKKKECDEIWNGRGEDRNPCRKLNKVGRQLKVMRETDNDLGNDIGKAWIWLDDVFLRINIIYIHVCRSFSNQTIMLSCYSYSFWLVFWVLIPT